MWLFKGHCRNVYKSCERWALEDKCEQVRTQTNFFDINCAVSCHQCVPDPKHGMDFTSFIYWKFLCIVEILYLSERITELILLLNLQS